MSGDARRQKLVEELFAAIDAKDAQAFSEFLTESAEFRFGSSPIVQGRERIRDAVDGFFASIAALKHDLDLVLGDGKHLLCEGHVTYTRHDGSRITLPFADSFVVNTDGIERYRIYIDIAPLYEQPA